MELMNQPFTGQLGNRLIELMDSHNYHTLNIAVAFARSSGVMRIKDSLERFRKEGGKVNLYVGVDLGGTSYEALTALLVHSDTLNVVHSENGQTFHVKIYHFLGKHQGVIIVGSHNLTGGGLWTNFESSVIISLEGVSNNTTKLLKGLERYIENLTSLDSSFMPIGAQEDVDKLLENGYVFKEQSLQARQAEAAKKSVNRNRLFGNGTPAMLPGVYNLKAQNVGTAFVHVEKPLSSPVSKNYNTIWFETKSMTGGSRNILDLSMKSLISRGDPKGTPLDLGDTKYMRGAVEFFGLEPINTKQSKNITLNFEGFDYTGNTILFPVGANPNGTWRLQIKGVNLYKKKITRAFKDKNAGFYLQNKIIAFERVSSDYFVLSVYAEVELERFKAASRLLARNGVTNKAKQLGIF